MLDERQMDPKEEHTRILVEVQTDETRQTETERQTDTHMCIISPLHTRLKECWSIAPGYDKSATGQLAYKTIEDACTKPEHKEEAI